MPTPARNPIATVCSVRMAGNASTEVDSRSQVLKAVASSQAKKDGKGNRQMRKRVPMKNASATARIATVAARTTIVEEATVDSA